MHKPLIAALILLLAASAAGNPDDYALHRINSTHWYFETTQNDLSEGTYSYQAFANNISTAARTVTYTLPDGLHQINSTHWYYKISKTDIPDGEHNYQAFANNVSSEYRILKVNVTTPPDPTTLANTTGNFWVNHTWDAGTGNVTDSYNISVNSVWHNTTTPAHYNDTYTAHAWQNITVWAYNTSGSGTLSAGSISQNTQIPNNPITITNTSDWSGDEGENVYVDYDATDADSDTPTFSCNRTDLFTDFSAATGTGNWTTTYTDAGTYYVDFGVSDGWGSTSNYTMTITVASVEAIPPDPANLANTTGNFWVNHTWDAGTGNVTDSYNISVNSVWHNGTDTFYNDTYTAHAWQNITVFAYNSSGTGTLSAGSVSQDTQIPNNPVTITNTSDWSGDAGANVYVDYDATDADSDTPTFSCNRTDLFTDFSAATGTGNWTTTYTDAGTYYVDFGVSDGYGSTSNYTMTITVVSVEMIPPDPVNLANTTGNFWVNHTWSTGREGWYLISGDVNGVFNGYNWTGSVWQGDSGIVSGLGCVGGCAAPTVFQKDDIWYLIAGGEAGVFNGYNWTGSAWQGDSAIASGLGDVGDYSAPTVFQKDDIWHLIAGGEAGVFNGYNWTGSAWQGDSGILSGLGGGWLYSAPTTFQKNEIWYLIVGDGDGYFNGLKWTGSTWQGDSGIASGLGGIWQYSTPTTFQKDGIWYLISGWDSGTFDGFNWTGSTWQGDSGIVSGLGNVDVKSAPTVFNMGNVTDSYNVSVNSVWHNTTTPAHYNDIYTAHAWQNITVFAYNSSGTGTQSSGSVSQNTQIPNNPITITNTSDWSGDAGNNVYVDYDATDADSDTPTFSCNRTDLFTDFSTSTGKGNWTATAGIYYIDFGVSDGWGSTSNYTMMITVNAIPPEPVSLQNSTGYFWVNHTWDAGTGNVTDSYNISVNSVWHNATADNFWNDTYLPEQWQNITVFAYNNSGTGTLSTGSVSQDTQAPAEITITLLSFTPETVYTNYTGSYNMSYGIEHTAVGLDNSSLAFLFGLNYTVDSSFSNSIRPPSNNIADSIPAFSVYGNIFRQFQRNVSPYLTWEFNNTITEGNSWKWGGLDYNSTRSLTINPVNSTYTYVNITGSHITVHQNMHYLDAMRMFASEKTPCSISKSQGLLFKTWDVDQINGRNDKYHITLYLGTGTDGTVPDSDIHIRMLNSSFNPLTDDPITSPFSTYIMSMSPAEWLDHAFTPHPNASYIRPVPINVSNLAIELDPTNYFYLYSDTVSPKPYVLYVTNADSGTNRTFGETGVAWTRVLPAGTTSAYAYTPNIFTTATRNYEEIDVQLYGADNNGTWAQSGVYNKSIGASQYPPSAPSFCHFEFAGYNDTSMDCTYRDNVAVWICPGTDPDGGAVTNNLTLWTANRTVCVATINTTFTGTTAVPVVFNTAPYYSTNTMYVLRCDTTDTAGSTATRWMYANFSLSPLGTTGAMVDGSRITFWGLDDVPALHTAISDPTAISLNNSTYTFHKAFHHSQYGDLWNVSSDIRIVSKCDISTPFYRLTGTDEIDGATILSWNETTGAPAPSTEEYRAYLYSDPYYSRINIRNSNISYLGKGISPYRGVYIQNGEGAVIDNNTFLHNGYGLYIYTGGNFSVTNNTFTDPVGSCLFLKDTTGNASIRDNALVSDVETSGVQLLRGGSGNEFINNSVTGEVQSAFLVKYISDSIFRGNSFDSIQYGIQVSTGCENITVTDNDVTAKMDVHGNPGWGITISSGTHNITDNRVTVHDGWGITVWKSNDTTLTNNSVTTDNASYTDYWIGGSAVGNIIRNPFDTTNSITVYDATSNARIENTDNTIFTEDSINYTYAYPTNFSLFADTQERFNITQHTMTATPATDRLRFWNLGWGKDVTFNASTNTAGNQVWFNFSNSLWHSRNITVYRNGTTYHSDAADTNGTFLYNYSGGWSERYFAFVRGNAYPDKPTLVAPANGAVGTSTNPTLRVTVCDIDDEPMNVTFYQQGGTQIGSTQTGIANGSTASVVWSGRSYSTTYYWYAVANDGKIGTQSDTWHFTTQATGGGGGGGGVTHDIAITGCNDWNGNAGTTAAIDFGYVNEDADAPVFTTNATEGTLDAATGVWTWATGAGDVGVYNWWFRVQNAYGNSDDCTVTVTVYTADTPLGLTSTTGNFWVDHTWNAVAGASEYRVRVNGVWHNGTDTHYLNTLMAPHGWSNITLASYNTSTGVSSFITDDVQIPNNPITITNYSDQNVFVGDNVTVDLDYADLDGDTPTFSCSRTDLFTDFSTATGTGNWTTATNGTYEIDFGVTDGWGSISNCTVKVRVGERPTLPTTIPISIWITITVLMFAFVVYTLHTRGYVQKIFGGMISVTMAYIQSQQIVSGNVVQITTLMSSADVMVTEKVEVVIPELAYLLLFVAAIMSLVTSAFIMKYIQFLYQKANAIKSKEEDL